MIAVIAFVALLYSLVGAVIGVVAAAIVYRNRRCLGRAAAFAGFACLAIMALASSGSVNGRGRPWISFINDTPKSIYPSCILGSIAGGLIAGVGQRPRRPT